MVKIEDIRYQSANGVDMIAATAWQPTDQPIRGIVQISHSLQEYIGQYSEFALFLVKYGYLVCGEDHLGHGRTARDADSLGFFSEYGGASHLVQDTRRLYRLMRQSYPNVPYYMLGQGTGSFIVRLYMAKYKDKLDGCLLGATCSSIKYPFAQRRIKIIINKNGLRYRSHELFKYLHSSYSRKEEKVNRREWLSRDPEALEAFLADPWCNFIPTVACYQDIISMIFSVSWRRWAQRVPKDLPILLFSGDMDPVCNYGKGTRDMTTLLEKAGIMDLTTIIYRGGHHAFWMEVNKNQIFGDIVNWLEQHASSPGSQSMTQMQKESSILSK